MLGERRTALRTASVSRSRARRPCRWPGRWVYSCPPPGPAGPQGRAVLLPKPHWRRGRRRRGTRRVPPAGQGTSGSADEPGWPYSCVVARGSKAFAHFLSLRGSVAHLWGASWSTTLIQHGARYTRSHTTQQWLLLHNDNYCMTALTSRPFCQPETERNK